MLNGNMSQPCFFAWIDFIEFDIACVFQSAACVFVSLLVYSPGASVLIVALFPLLWVTCFFLMLVMFCWLCLFVKLCMDFLFYGHARL